LRKKILITGGTGFIGYHLAKKCLKLKWLVTSVSTNKPLKLRKLPSVKYLYFDISKIKSIKKKLSKDFDYVVNLAGYVDHTKSNKVMKSHYLGCKNLSMFFKESKIKKFVQIGSCIEYGKKKSPQKEDKNIFNKTYSVYGKAKLMSTRFLLNLYKESNFPVTILRLYLVYGTHQDPNRIIPITIMNSLKNNEFECSKGTQIRDFLYIDDLISAIIKVLKSKKSIGEIFNIGSGKPIMIRNIIYKIHKIIKSGKPLFGKIKFRRDEIMKLYPNTSKIKKILSWKQKININVGLKKTIAFYKKKYVQES